MTTTAFTLLFLPACLAVPAGLALGAIAECLIEKIGAAIMPSTPRAERRKRPLGLPAPARRDEAALSNARRPIGLAPWM
ncbi:MAG: hypothetical protein BGO49_06705 [Planctomycetales bacterium 71-10]|nr:MAG: hypothetical protein BGO49_06705 [Planctomycetales bacterium 71-10]